MFFTKIRLPVWLTNVYPFFLATFKVAEKELPGNRLECRVTTPGGILEFISMTTIAAENRFIESHTSKSYESISIDRSSKVLGHSAAARIASIELSEPLLGETIFNIGLMVGYSETVVRSS